MATQNAASRLNQIQLSRFRDPPRKFNFDLFHGATVSPGGGYRLRWRQNQDVTGAIVEEGAPIQVTRVSTEPGIIHVEAEEMLASGVIVLRHTVILTTTGSVLNWTVPDSWNDADNIIECIGGGGGGAGTLTTASSAARRRRWRLCVSHQPEPDAGRVRVSYRVGSGGAGGSIGTAHRGRQRHLVQWCDLRRRVGRRQGRTARHQTAPAMERAVRQLAASATVKFSGGKAATAAVSSAAAAAAVVRLQARTATAATAATARPATRAAAAAAAAAEPTAERTAATRRRRVETPAAAATTGSVSAAARRVTRTAANGGGGCGNGELDDSGEVGHGSAEQVWTQTIAPIISAGPGSRSWRRRRAQQRQERRSLRCRRQRSRRPWQPAAAMVPKAS